MKNLLYYWWVPSTFMYYALYHYVSVRSNQTGNMKWVWIGYTIGALCPFWILLARQSKNLLFDGVVYDNMILLSFITVASMMGVGEHFSAVNWLGICCAVLGLTLMKV